jgi:tRNA/tmRNA/rRNA uracil-C5-methylase (TrmA/RlmC/RlmD family)
MEESLMVKKQFLLRLFPEYESIIEEVQSPPENERWHYRRKICLRIKKHNGSFKMGMLRRKEFIPIEDCPVHLQTINDASTLILKSIPSDNNISPVYYAHSGKQIILVLKNSSEPDVSWLTDEIKDTLKSLGIEGLWLHLHPSAGKKVFGKTGWHLIWGKPYSLEEQGFRYGPVSFFQQLPSIFNAAVDMTFDFLSIKPGDSIIDLYSGIGISLKKWKETGASVIGVELNGEAVEMSKANVPEVEILRGKCSDRIPQLNEFIEKGCKLVTFHKKLFANPPRTGLEPEIISWICNELKPSRIAYLSCSAGTLRRDTDILSNSEYKLIKLIPLDFFPQTHHLETLAFFTK